VDPVSSLPISQQGGDVELELSREANSGTTDPEVVTEPYLLPTQEEGRDSSMKSRQMQHKFQLMVLVFCGNSPLGQMNND
jgi:hypothetical protein